LRNPNMSASHLVMAALVLGLSLLIGGFAGAAEQRGQKAVKPGGATKAGEPPPGDLDAGQSELRAVIERYIADRGSLTRSYPVEASLARRSRMRRFYTDWLDRLAKLDFEALSQDGRIDYLLFRNHLHHELRQLDIREKALAEATPLIPFAQPIIDLEEARRRMQPIDAAKAAATLDSLNRQVEQIRKAVEAGPRSEGKAEGKVEPTRVKKAVANRAARAINRLRNTLRDWFGFYNGYDPVFTWWVGEPYKKLDKTLESYAAFLQERVAGIKPGDQTAIIGDPIGRDALLSELAYEMIPYTPEELIEIANRELAWSEAEIKRASRQLGYGEDWRKALEHVKTLHVAPGKQPELIRDLALEAIAFLEQHDLVTIPELARETWRMEMMSSERQLVNPFFTGGEVISVSYPTNTMSHEQKMMSMRGNNIHFSRATVFHELIPGHHLQGFMTARYKPYRSVFGTPFWGEGWALYWEMLLWDLNFPRSPEDRIGMLFWRMHRSTRIIFSLSFHLEKMTEQECVDFLVQRVGHEPENAAAEVRRSFAGNYGPLYQAAYMLGGLQIRSLYRELVGSGKMTSRAFHDAVLKENRIPVEMVRASLSRQKLARDFTSNWRFYDLGARPAEGSRLAP